MKKIITLLGVCLFLAVGCKDNKEVGAENVNSMEQANMIIEYTNSVVDYMNDANSFINSRERDFQKLIELAESKKIRYSSDIPIDALFMNFRIGGTKDKDAKMTQPPTVLSTEEQEFFKEKVAFYKAQRDLLSGTAVTYIKYLKNEDYKDDNWAKAKEYAEKIEKAYNNCMDTRPLISAKIDEVTERAEEIILADSPIKDAIMTVKADLKSVQNLVNTFYIHDEEGGKKEELDKLYTELEANLEKHKGMYVDELTKENSLNSYVNFYSSVVNNLGDVRKVLRKVREGKKLNDSDFSFLTRVNNNAVSSYNRFI
ncbi:DUF3829 domain-containing protein [Myroides marinus]|uniref:DUF3829 domain-containing protein n=1 Tax=Myroides marinus TaxID=703342 RepID=UPI00257575F9|nr:DUF3829 domain-containing protein [Myroides marinus]MDM1403901.1 DUF3829 domain-containing protein [Myroides marinus]